MDNHTERASTIDTIVYMLALRRRDFFKAFPSQPRLPSEQKHPQRSMSMGPEKWLGEALASFEPSRAPPLRARGGGGGGGGGGAWERG